MTATFEQSSGTFYPVDEKAVLLTRLAGKKELTSTDIILIEMLGITCLFI